MRPAPPNGREAERILNQAAGAENFLPPIISLRPDKPGAKRTFQADFPTESAAFADRRAVVPNCWAARVSTGLKVRLLLSSAVHSVFPDRATIGNNHAIRLSNHAKACGAAWMSLMQSPAKVPRLASLPVLAQRLVRRRLSRAAGCRSSGGRGHWRRGRYLVGPDSVRH